MKIFFLLTLFIFASCNKASDSSLSETFGVETPTPEAAVEETEVASEYGASLNVTAQIESLRKVFV